MISLPHEVMEGKAADFTPTAAVGLIFRKQVI
jgi:hypothetical protein